MELIRKLADEIKSESAIAHLLIAAVTIGTITEEQADEIAYRNGVLWRSWRNNL